MKLNWGYRVAILYISFAGLIIFLVIKSFNQTVDLVATDYYAQELKYQGKMESIERNNNLEHPTMIYSNEYGIRVEFPADFDPKEISGVIYVFRPSDKQMDFKVDIASMENHTQLIPAAELQKGMYRVKVDFTYHSQTYYTEKQVVIR